METIRLVEQILINLVFVSDGFFFVLQYPQKIGKYSIASIRDLTVDVDTSEMDGRARLPVDPNNQMITFTFNNGVVITLRTSGTEPKIKYYAEMCAKPDEK